MYLYLDTTERDNFRVALIDKREVLKDKTVFSVRGHSEKLLRTIDALLNPPPHHPRPPSLRSGVSGRAYPSSESRGLLRGIAVVKGPGSFTSLRVGISTANALAYAWGVAVVGVTPDYDLRKLDVLFKKKKKLNIVLPEYGGEPHITSRRAIKP